MQQKEQGTILITALLAAMLLIVLTATIQYREQHEAKAVQLQQAGERAQALATAGAYWIIEQMKTDIRYAALTQPLTEIFSLTTPTSHDSATITITPKSTKPKQYLVKIVSHVQEAQRQIYLHIAYEQPAATPYDYVVCGKTVENTLPAQVQGDVRVTQELRNEASFHIIGRLTVPLRTTPQVPIGCLNYSETNESLPLTLPSLPVATPILPFSEVYGRQNWRGDATIDSLTIKRGSSLSGQGILYINQDFIMEENSSLEGKWFIIAKRHIILGPHSSLKQAVLLAQENLISQAAYLEGSLLSQRKISLAAAQQIQYIPALIQYFGLPTSTGTVLKVEWQPY